MPNFSNSISLVHPRIIRLIIGVFSLVTLLTPTIGSGAEIFGRVFLPNGTTATGKPILLNGRQIGNTDASGGYRLSLPPGNYTFTIESRNIPIVLPPPGLKQDIRL